MVKLLEHIHPEPKPKPGSKEWWEKMEVEIRRNKQLRAEGKPTLHATLGERLTSKRER